MVEVSSPPSLGISTTFALILSSIVVWRRRRRYRRYFPITSEDCDHGGNDSKLFPVLLFLFLKCNLWMSQIATINAHYIMNCIPITIDKGQFLIAIVTPYHYVLRTQLIINHHLVSLFFSTDFNLFITVLPNYNRKIPPIPPPLQI